MEKKNINIKVYSDKINLKSAKKSYQIQLISSAELVHTACVPRTPAAVMCPAGVVRGRHQTKTNQASVELCSTESIVPNS